MGRLLDKICELTKQGYQIDFNRLSITNGAGDRVVAGIRVTLWNGAYSESSDQLYVCDDLEGKICDMLDVLKKGVERIIQFEREREF